MILRADSVRLVEDEHHGIFNLLGDDFVGRAALSTVLHCAYEIPRGRVRTVGPIALTQSCLGACDMAGQTPQNLVAPRSFNALHTEPGRDVAGEPVCKHRTLGLDHFEEELSDKFAVRFE